MPQFRKKPIVIEAWQMTDAVLAGEVTSPPWLVDAVAAGKVKECGVGGKRYGFTVETLEGPMLGLVGDWLILGVIGELYPCKAHVFDMSYEQVSEESPS